MAGPVTVVVARAVTAGREDEFYRWAHRLTDAAERFPGFLGSGLLRPTPGSEVWNVVYRFDTPEHLAAWERSGIRTAMLAQGSAFMRTVAERRLDGMDPWFASTGSTGPPRWKTFLMTATVILVLQSAVAAVLRPVVAGWPTLARSAVVIVPVVGLMTWVVMPRLSRWLRRWLYPS